MSEQVVFETQSERNAAAVLEQIDGQCSCQPYVDVFTFPMWRKQGFHVVRGETSHIRVTTYREIKTGEVDEKNGKEKTSF